MKLVRLLDAPAVVDFMHDGERRELRHPDGPPTLRQLAYLNRLGALAIVESGQVVPISKGAAAGAIRRLPAAGPLEELRP